MGKRLGDAVFDNAILNVDYSDVQKSNVYINGTKWAVDGNSRYQGKFVDVTNYKGWAFKIGGVWIPSGNSGYWWLRFAMVTSNSFSNGGDIPFVNVAPYNAKVENSTSEWHEGVIPSIEGNIYLYIYCYNSTGTPVDFPPELYVIDPNPSSRVERLETLTEGVDEIKEGWFAISGEPYQESYGGGIVGKKQGVDWSGKFYSDSNAVKQSTIPKIPGSPTNGSVYTPSASECFCVDDLPNKVLTAKINQTLTAPGRWAVYIVMYNSNLGFIERYPDANSAPIFFKADNGWERTFDFKTKPSAKYFKLIIYCQSDGSTNDDALSLTFQDNNFMEITQQVPAQESMPDRVTTLEGKVEALRGGSAGKITVMSYNIGHFALGQSSNTSISDQYEDAQDYSAPHPYSNYAAQKTRWRQMLNEFSPDVLLMCEYNPVFAKNGPSKNQEVSAQEAVFGCLPYKREGTRSGYMQTAIYANLLLGTSVETVYQDYTQWRYYQCVEVNMGGVPVKLVATHLDFTDSQHGRTDRESQFAELVAAFANDDHVIICGDFNNDNASEFEAFDPDDGWVMANHGYVGDVFTYPSTGGVVKNGQQVPQYAIDNIIVKGFAMSNIRYIDRKELTDHIGVVCDLTLI